MAMEVYKRNQGKYTRLTSAFAISLIVLIGCYELFLRLQGSDWVSAKAGLWISAMVPTIIFLVLSALVFWLVNKPTVADFMIAAEGEMKKVNWSSRAEIAVSTFVVICVVIIFAILLGSSDFIFQLFFGWLLS